MTKKRGLSDQDQALWKAVTKDIKPIDNKDQLGVDVPQVTQPKDQESLPKEWTEAGGGLSKSQFAHPALDARRAKLRGAGAVPNASLDRKVRRDLGRGRVVIDRKIDLHGMNQEAAFAVLTRTIERSVRRGQKTVLVVTGKGGKRFSQLGDTPVAERTRADFSPEGGVLKRMVPIWLNGPTLSAYVESFGEAAPDHGGGGALYVRLRKFKANKS